MSPYRPGPNRCPPYCFHLWPNLITLTLHLQVPSAWFLLCLSSADLTAVWMGASRHPMSSFVYTVFVQISSPPERVDRVGGWGQEDYRPYHD